MSVGSYSDELLSARGREASSVLAFLDVFGSEDVFGFECSLAHDFLKQSFHFFN